MKDATTREEAAVKRYIIVNIYGERLEEYEPQTSKEAAEKIVREEEEKGWEVSIKEETV